MCVQKKIVIERTRDLIYLKFVATDFFPKIISPSAGKNSETQRSPCYSAVSALLKNPLPDHSNYSPFCHTHHLTPDQYFTSLFGPDLYRAASLETNTSLLQRFTAESRNSGETQCLEEAEQQAEASVGVPYPPLQIVNSLSLFSLSLSSLCSLSQSSLFSLSTIPSFSSDQFFVLLR